MVQVIIRQETYGDRGEVNGLIEEAFAGGEYSDGNEHNLVVALRNSEAFIPELSLVAEEGGKILGHILFTKVEIDREVALALAPLSVLPARQREGIGLALMKAGHEVAKDLGYGLSIVLGSRHYYPKGGYVQAAQYRIKAPFDVPEENYMALQLGEDTRRVDGLVQYDEAFAIDWDRIKPGDVVRHFKAETVTREEAAAGRYLYKIIGIAIHSETRERLMVYRALYGDGGIYVRPLEMFLGKVDRMKYPEIKQEYRFEKIETEVADE